MIDLRSDTLTKPTAEMRKKMYDAEVGDAGREDSRGRGEDPTLNRLEDIAAQLMGKEAAMFIPSGTMANLIALMTFCSAGQHVGVEKNLHVYRNEKAAFMDRPGGLIPEFFETDSQSIPILNSVKALLEERRINLLCLENTHNFAGGTCLSKEQMQSICSIAKENGVPVHLDGARINNASIYLNTPVEELVATVDTVMFCLSKGLGAPVGSILCGSHDFIVEARKTRRLIGGTMRQAGVLAAAGIVAIQKERDRLTEDHENARLLAERIEHNDKIRLDIETVQTNIVKVDVSPCGYDAKTFQQGLESRGLKVNVLSEKFIRMVTRREIEREDVVEASNILNEYCESL
ncbi:MAG: GntG family PLP-dependent aldolase [Bacteroidota bacterium]